MINMLSKLLGVYGSMVPVYCFSSTRIHVFANIAFKGYVATPQRIVAVNRQTV